MKKLLFLFALAACGPGAAQLNVEAPKPKPTSAPSTPDVPVDTAKIDEILQKHVDARGGMDKLRAIKSLRLTGHARLGGDDDAGIEASFAVITKRPGSTRSELSFQGLTGVEAYDGTEGWSTEPWGGRRDPFRKSEDEARQLARSADLDGPLVDWKTKGHKVEYLGTDDIDGSPAHKLRITYKDGDFEYRYLEATSFLEIRVVRHVHIRGTERVTETDVGEYEQVAGVWFPFAIESGRKGSPRSFRLTIDHAEANAELDDAHFKFPPAGSKVAKVLPDGAPAAQRLEAPPAPPAAATTFDKDVLSGLGARNIGSAQMSGRIAAIDAYDAGGKTTLYVGAASGGVWKSLDGGTTFKPVFDKTPVQSIGAIAIDKQKPTTVWVGTGESWTRNSVSIGNGIYKSTDGGDTWTNMGLPESERIARILVHPRASDVVYVCVPGKLWSDSPDRGVYKTTDGGKTWAHVLKGSNLSTGCGGLSMDQKNPDVLYAGLWDFRRKGWTFRSGGDGPDAPSGSGLHRTTDGGKTWTKLDGNGLPKGPWGRVEVAIAPSDPNVVYTVIESTHSALFASTDGGSTWQERDKSQSMVWRPFYFARLIVDPLVPTRLFKPNLNLIVSEDGGKSFTKSGGGAHGDWHDIWIDPTNTKHIIGADDGGLWISFDGGNRWWKSGNLPISQFYHVSVDNKDPYQVYGGLQDNSSWVGDSAYPGGITNNRWENLYGGDGFYTLVDPTDPDAVYAESQGGHIGRVDRRTRQVRDIQPKGGYKEKLRFNWNTPIHVSSTQKGTLYIGAQFLFRSRDRGDNWERISPDLTTNDPEKQKQEQSGGVTVDNSSAEMHTTIYSISESPKDPNVIWVGTDDGNLQITRDAGKTWTNVVKNVPGLPPNSWVSWVEASRFDPATAYATFDRHTFGDMGTWVYKTTDHGKTWTRIGEKGTKGYAHVVKEDTVKKDLLFLGTELGLFISIDGGASFAEFHGGGFPSVAVREVQVHPRDGDLVIGTHGRGIWIVDDLTPLRSLTPRTLQQQTTFLPARTAQQRLPAEGGWAEGDAAFYGRNPANGAVIGYYLSSRHLYGRLKLEILDKEGKLVDTIPATKRRGINRVVWTMQVKPPRVPRAAQVAFNATQGPRVLPGTYTARLTRGKETVETKIEIALDARAPFKLEDRKAGFAAAMRVHALFGEMSALVDKIDAARGPMEGKDDARSKKLEDLKKKIVATKEGGAITGEERIREHTDSLYSALLAWEGRPTRYQLDRIDALKKELDEVAKEVDEVLKGAK